VTEAQSGVNRSFRAARHGVRLDVHADAAARCVGLTALTGRVAAGRPGISGHSSADEFGFTELPSHVMFR
jgi:hypothetical protein